MKQLLIAIILTCSWSAFGSLLVWEHYYTDEAGNLAWFNVYHSRHGSDWKLIGTTSNQTFTVTNRGWYAVEAALGTNRSEFATCAFNPFAIMRVKTLRIGK